MALPRKLRRKAEKIHLAFEYVHDRFLGLPKYSERFWRLVRIPGGIVLFLVVVLTFPLWQPFILQGVDQVERGSARLVKLFTPPPLPPITVIAGLFAAHEQVQPALRVRWDRKLRALSVNNIAVVGAIPQWQQENPDAFFALAGDYGKPVRSLQADFAELYRAIPATAGRLVRNAVTPFVTEPNGFPATLESEIALLHALTNFNQLSIPEVLHVSADRTIALDDFLAHGKNLEQSARTRYFNIQARFATAQRRTAGLATMSAADEAELQQALQNFIANKVEGSFEDFVATRKNGVLSNAEANLLQGLGQAYAAQLNILTTRLSAIEANRAGLISGIVVVPTEGVDLGLIQTEQR